MAWKPFYRCVPHNLSPPEPSRYVLDWAALGFGLRENPVNGLRGPHTDISKFVQGALSDRFVEHTSRSLGCGSWLILWVQATAPTASRNAGVDHEHVSKPDYVELILSMMNMTQMHGEFYCGYHWFQRLVISFPRGAIVLGMKQWAKVAGEWHRRDLEPTLNLYNCNNICRLIVVCVCTVKWWIVKMS